MNDLCIDIDYSQLFKHGQKIGGDVFFLDRDEGSNVITAILSDGLGSGVRANVVASPMMFCFGYELTVVTSIR